MRALTDDLHPLLNNFAAAAHHVRILLLTSPT
jgi:hypothetical protein